MVLSDKSFCSFDDGSIVGQDGLDSLVETDSQIQDLRLTSSSEKRSSSKDIASSTTIDQVSTKELPVISDGTVTEARTKTNTDTSNGLICFGASEDKAAGLSEDRVADSAGALLSDDQSELKDFVPDGEISNHADSRDSPPVERVDGSSNGVSLDEVSALTNYVNSSNQLNEVGLVNGEVSTSSIGNCRHPTASYYQNQLSVGRKENVNDKPSKSIGSSPRRYSLYALMMICYTLLVIGVVFLLTKSTASDREQKIIFENNIEDLSIELIEAAQKQDYAKLRDCMLQAKYHSDKAYLQGIFPDTSETDFKTLLALQNKKFKKALASYNKAMSDVERAMNAFFDEFSPETADRLLRIFSSLQAASKPTSTELQDMKVLYEKMRVHLTDKISIFFRSLSSVTSNYDSWMPKLKILFLELHRGLVDHVVDDLKHQLDFLHSTIPCGTDHDKFIQDGEELDRLSNSRWWWWKHRYDARRSQLQGKLKIALFDVKEQGIRALQSRDFPMAQECIDVLDDMYLHLKKYVDSVTLEASVHELSKKSVVAFQVICAQMEQILLSDDRKEFESVFADYRSLVLSVPLVIASAEAEFQHVNQLLLETLRKDISEVLSWQESFDFADLQFRIERTKRFGGFVADHVTRFHEETKLLSHISDCSWLADITSICLKHFSCGRKLASTKDFAIIGLPPSATLAEVNTAYLAHDMNLHYKRLESGVQKTRNIFREVVVYDSLGNWQKTSKINQNERPTASWQKLQKIVSDMPPCDQPFDDLLRGIGGVITSKVQELLIEQRYGEVKRVISQLDDLYRLEGLVSLPLQSRGISSVIENLVQSHVEALQRAITIHWEEKNYRDLNGDIEDLKLLEENLGICLSVSKSWYHDIMRKVQSEIEGLERKARGVLSNETTARSSILEFKRLFIQLGSVMVNLSPFVHFTKAIMIDVLDYCLDSEWGFRFLFDFGLLLQKRNGNSKEDENHISSVLLAEFPHFQSVMTMIWNEETLQKPAEDTVMGIRGSHWRNGAMQEMTIETNELLRSFNTLEKQYVSLLKEYLPLYADLSVLVQDTVAEADSLKPISIDSGWNGKLKKQLLSIVARVFAVFTVLKSGDSYSRLVEAEGASSEIGENLLMKPHNIQVLSLLQMLGYGSSDSKLQNHLLQIRTGEGKSLILGTAAVVFGLLGFSTRVVCYSDYLSSRDYKLFRDVIEKFGVKNLIKYVKIGTLSEDDITAHGDIRLLTSQLLRGELIKNQLPSPTTKSPYDILLIDEVDVFFGPEFYGKTHNPVAKIKEPEIADILQYIWSECKKDSCPNIRDIQAMGLYSRLVKKLPKYLVDNEIGLMIDQVERIDDPPYHLDQETDRIGYKDMDTINFSFNYGYKTVFAYLKEADAGNLKKKEATLENWLAMYIPCGHFSYANISPRRILGVSGTLEVLEDYQKRVLANYGIDTFTYVPSVYGKSNFRFDEAGDGIIIESSKSDYFHSISAQVKDATKQQRAAIVFFPNKERMNEFVDSPYYGKLGRNKQLLTEEMSHTEKEFVIKKAATAGQITVSIAVFGRGTDFFCKDDRVQNGGGVHVIQGFLSADQSEEVQIQGRTARQGKKGSYQMILLDSDLLNEFGIQNPGSIARAERHSYLKDARSRRLQKHYQKIDQNILDATKKDKITRKYFKALLAGNEKDAHDGFKQIYRS